jgi:hypothetical protein
VEIALIHTQQSENFMGILNHLLTLFITSQVIAVSDVSAGNQDAVHSRQKGVKKEAVIDSARAHQTNETHIGRVLHATHPCQIGSGIGTPITDKTYNFGFERFRH